MHFFINNNSRKRQRNNIISSDNNNNIRSSAATSSTTSKSLVLLLVSAIALLNSVSAFQTAVVTANKNHYHHGSTAPTTKKFNHHDAFALAATTAIPPPSNTLYNPPQRKLQDNERHWPWENWLNKNDNNKVQDQQAALLEKAKNWEKKYCSVAGLRKSFGGNKNLLWGDFDPTTTRKLYKSLMPVALYDLYEAGLPPQDLAPLAYRARVAAKLYARERCRVPYRVAANLFDGYRQWRKYGSFDCTGMSYQQVWEKYAKLIEDETSEGEHDPEDITTKICVKILEKSCQSNEMIDNLVLNNKKAINKKHTHCEMQQLKHVSEELDRDVRELLRQHDAAVGFEQQREARKFRALRHVAQVKRRVQDLVMVDNK